MTLAELAIEWATKYVVSVPKKRPSKPLCPRCRKLVGFYMISRLGRSGNFWRKQLEKKFAKHWREEH